MDWNRVMLNNYGTPPITLDHGQGCHVWDTEGREYIDALAGIAVSSLGHAHPAITAAVSGQVGKLAHTSNLYGHAPGLLLADRLESLFPHSQIFFGNSGTEANEAALKLVRRHAHATGRPQGIVLAFTNGFHGRTAGTLALTGKPAYQEGFAPLPGQIIHVPFNDVAALEAAFHEHDIVGVFTEFIQGEGGIIPMTPAMASRLDALCAANDALLVADEVQTGVGRTGSFFAFDHYDVRPDIVTLAKGIAGGLPLGVMMAHERLAPLLGPGSHGSTFGGNPVSCAAANAVLDVLDTNDLLANAARLGDQAKAAFAAAGLTVRGQGLLLGIPTTDPAGALATLRANGILVGTAGDAIRLAPPLIMDTTTWQQVVDGIIGVLAPTPIAAAT